ncbi:TIR-NBS-LRR class disease resistance protein [Quillaja saponaria]|uniref:TIR-NBS-LRR class disease resistance protein n=1 Tax=Quillaja saponaria TaxID=32244 RepID=A0AAD7PN54_QUISA|nr:TIR-NBS-LRR class disease resistance protein [Quillaja saponaria]
MVKFSLTDCESSVNFTASENFRNTLMIHIGGFRKVTNSLGGSILQGWTATDIGDLFLPGACSLDLFIYKAEGPLVSFEVPHVVDGHLAGFNVGIVYSSSMDRMSSHYLTTMLVINHTKDTIQMSMPVTKDEAIFHEDNLWQGLLSNMEGGDKLEVILDIGYQFAVKETAVYLVYGKSIDKNMSASQFQIRFLFFLVNFKKQLGSRVAAVMLRQEQVLNRWNQRLKSQGMNSVLIAEVNYIKLTKKRECGFT